MAMSTINVMTRNRKKHTGDTGENSDDSEYSGVGKIDANWFDQFVDKRNISLDD